MKIEESSVALFEYVLTNGEGEVLDKSGEGAPLAYLHGHGNIIPGLEEAMTGREAGDSFQVEIPPEKAYGIRSDELIQTVSRELFEGAEDLSVGMKFQAQTPEGLQILTITKLEGDEVTIDGNHELAGVALNFDVTIRDVRQATAEELEHGHVHGPGGHQH